MNPLWFGTSVYISKKYIQNNQKWISESELQKVTKRRFFLHSQSIQAVCHKYLFSRDAAYQAIQKGIQTVRYPYKKKKHYNTKWAKDGFRIFSNGRAELSLGIQQGKHQKPIVLHTSDLPQGQIKEIEFCYDQKLYLSVSFEDGIQNETYTSGKSAGVDLGEIHTIASFCETGESLIITGRKIRPRRKVVDGLFRPLYHWYLLFT